MIIIELVGLALIILVVEVYVDFFINIGKLIFFKSKRK